MRLLINPTRFSTFNLTKQTEILAHLTHVRYNNTNNNAEIPPKKNKMLGMYERMVLIKYEYWRKI